MLDLPDEIEFLLEELVDEDTLSTDDDNVLKQIAKEYRLDYPSIRKELADRGGPDLTAEEEEQEEEDADQSILLVLLSIAFLIASIVASVTLVGWSLVLLFRAIFG